MKVVWLASYPKSGNTFLRMLLHNYLYGETKDTGLVSERIPDIHLHKTVLNTSSDERKLVKTHFCFSWNHPYAEHTSGFIYIMRNPRDVLLSSARYLCTTSSHDELRKFSQYFINEMGVPLVRKLRVGNWPEHVASWLSFAPKVPHLFITYEDLRMDTGKILRSALHFIGLEPDDSRIQMAVDSCEINKARTHEIEEKKLGRIVIYNELPNNRYFVGEGKTGQSLIHIGEDIEQLYKDKFGSIANLFGYE